MLAYLVKLFALVHRDIAHNCDDTDFLRLASPSSALIAE